MNPTNPWDREEMLQQDEERERHERRYPQPYRYCPGSAPGSPDWYPLDEAQDKAVVDGNYIETMVKANALVVPISWPHLGQCEPRCCRHNPPTDLTTYPTYPK